MDLESLKCHLLHFGGLGLDISNIKVKVRCTKFECWKYMRSETQSGPVAKYATSSSDGIKPAPCGSLDQRSIQWSLVQLPAERLECISRNWSQNV